MYKFFVIINNETGEFYKKHNYKYYSFFEKKKTGELFTNKLGRARIFESYAVAKQAIPHYYNENDWLEDGLVSIKEMIANYV